MAELPSVISSALIHAINTLESDNTHQYHWNQQELGKCVFVCEVNSFRQKCHTWQGRPRIISCETSSEKIYEKEDAISIEMLSNQQTNSNAFRNRRRRNKLPYLKALPKKSSVPSERNRKPSLCLPRTVVTIWNHQIGPLVKGHLVKSRGQSIWITRIQNTCH